MNTNGKSAQALAMQMTGVRPVKNEMREAQLIQAAMKVPPELRAFLGRRALASQIQTKPGKRYYSTIRFGWDVRETHPDAANPQLTVMEYSLPQKKLVAFGYGIQDEAVTAGFPKDFRPSEAETNLITRSDTGGATVKITGISFHLSATSDAGLAQYVWDNAFADISLDGSNRYMLLGRFDNVPQAGGIYGTGASYVTQPALTDAVAMVSTATNGMPIASSFFRLPSPITWNPASRIDSKFQIRFEVVRNLLVKATPRAAGPLVQAFNPPRVAGERGTYVDLVTYLHTRELSPRSKQM